MGGFSSKAKVQVIIDDGPVYSGSTMSGRILFHVPKKGLEPMVNFHVQGTMLAVEGAPKLNLINQQFRLDVSTSGGLTMKKGQYEFPFQIQIPPDTPPVMGICPSVYQYKVERRERIGNRTYYTTVNEEKRGQYAVISYTLSVSILGCRHQVHLPITKPPPTRNGSPLFVTPTSFPVTSGHILLGFAADTNQLMAGQNLAIRCALINNSQAAIDGIRVDIAEVVGPNSYQSLPYLSGHMRRVQFFNHMFTLNDLGYKLPVGGNVDTAMAMLNAGQHRLNITIPATAAPSFQHPELEISYVLKVFLHVAGCTYPISQEAEVVICAQPWCVKPVLVPGPSTPNIADLVRGNKTALPRNWKPQVAPLITMQVAANPAAAPSAPPVVHAALVSGDLQTGATWASVADASLLPPSPANGVYSSFNEFITALKASSDPCLVLQTYMDTHSADDFHEEQFYAIFMTAKSAADQPRFATILAASMSFVTCVQVTRALAGCRDPAKCEVAEALLRAGPILDKHENARMLLSSMSSAQYAMVAMYLE